MEATKQCPFCAETIQAAAVVCRFCNRDLNAPVVDAAKDQALLNISIEAYTKEGWRIVSQTPSGFQAVKPKTWSTVGLLFFVVTPLLLGCFGTFLFGAAALWLFLIGGVGFIIMLAAYLSTAEQQVYVTPQSIRASAQEKLHPLSRDKAV